LSTRPGGGPSERATAAHRILEARAVGDVLENPLRVPLGRLPRDVAREADDHVALHEMLPIEAARVVHRDGLHPGNGAPSGARVGMLPEQAPPKGALGQGPVVVARAHQIGHDLPCQPPELLFGECRRLQQGRQQLDEGLHVALDDLAVHGGQRRAHVERDLAPQPVERVLHLPRDEIAAPRRSMPMVTR